MGGTRDAAYTVVEEEHVTKPFNLSGRPMCLPANESITHEIVCCTLALISKKNIDSLVLLPLKEKGGVFRRCFPLC